jgi:hypothetical protein
MPKKRKRAPKRKICQGRTKAGMPCRSIAVDGVDRCYWHGGRWLVLRLGRDLADGPRRRLPAQRELDLKERPLKPE